MLPQLARYFATAAAGMPELYGSVHLPSIATLMDYTSAFNAPRCLASTLPRVASSEF